MSWKDKITVDPAVLVGKPVVRGTRIAVEFVVELLAEGWSEDQILDNYPGLTHDDIQACLHYATEVLKSERVYLMQSMGCGKWQPSTRTLGNSRTGRIFPRIVASSYSDLHARLRNTLPGVCLLRLMVERTGAEILPW